MDTSSLIASALALPEQDRFALIDALHTSVADPSLDHDGGEDPAAVAAAWRDEIAKRLDDLRSGRVKPVPADEAERMIRSDAQPPV